MNHAPAAEEPLAPAGSAGGSPADAAATVAWRIRLAGPVQGIGLRPAVTRLAQRWGVAGEVRNASQGVLVEIEGAAQAVHQFLNQLAGALPGGGAGIERQAWPVPPRGHRVWSIAPTLSEGPLSVPAPLDRALCQDCLSEVANPGDRRRHGYPLVGCAGCGPRYSVLESLPFSRQASSWRAYPLCAACRREFQSAGDRRFHAELNTCAICGPSMRLLDSQGRQIDADWRAALVAALRQGETIALLGVGGYQLLCDATSAVAVQRLRLRKRRPQKPLAVLVRDVAAARRLAWLDAAEEEALTDPANPIVLVRCRDGTLLAREAVQPGLRQVGLLLPTTALHWILAHDANRPLVCTSGNVEGEPLAYRPSAVLDRSLAQLWLEHDREILQPIDDSVVRVIAARRSVVRLGRGLGPLACELPAWLTQRGPALALGGHQKTALAWYNGAQAALGPHLGDLDSSPSRERYTESLARHRQLYRFEPLRWFWDAHPDYASTRWAAERELPGEPIQHHHAHIVGTLAEHGWEAGPVLGIAWDGSGQGSDGTLWGGECLLADWTSFERVARLRPIRLPGGEAAIGQPWRTALGLLEESLPPSAPLPPALAGLELVRLAGVKQLLGRPRLCPRASSVGRLFDGLAALLLGEACQGFEARPAMLLEDLADPAEPGSYHLPLGSAAGGGCAELDWRPLVRGAMGDLAMGIAPGAIAMRFHRALARAVWNLAARWIELPVVLSGGVFQNRLLTELVVELFSRHNARQRLLLPGRVPAGDGGLALGQLAIGLARWSTATPE